MYTCNKKTPRRTLCCAATTTSEALKKWAAKTGEDPEEAEKISLEFQDPPIMKMGTPIKKLVNCQVLSLACNMIERPVLSPTLRNLRVLNLSRNNLQSLSGIEVLGKTLEELWVSYNLIDKLKPIESMVVLRVLLISHNNIREWAEIKHLAALPAPLDLSFSGNPIQQSMSEERFRRELTKRVPNLAKLDFVPIFKEEPEC